VYNFRAKKSIRDFSYGGCKPIKRKSHEVNQGKQFYEFYISVSKFLLEALTYTVFYFLDSPTPFSRG